MNTRRLITRSLIHYWRTGVAVIFGLAIACAVIVGSLVIGDTVRGSIRDTALARLGRIDYALVAPHFFRRQFAADMMRDSRLEGKVTIVVPVIITRGAVKRPDHRCHSAQRERDRVDDSFWELCREGEALRLAATIRPPMSQSLARDLGVKHRRQHLVNIDRQSAIPGGTLFEESPRRTPTVRFAWRSRRFCRRPAPAGSSWTPARIPPATYSFLANGSASRSASRAMANALLAQSSGAVISGSRSDGPL